MELFQGRNRHHFPRKLAPVDSYLWKVEMFPIISFGSLELNKPVDVLTRFQGGDGGQAVQRDGTNIQLKGIGLTKLILFIVFSCAHGHAGLATSLLCRASKVCKCSVPPVKDSMGILCKCITVSGLYEEYCTCVQYLDSTRNIVLVYSIWIVRGILH